MKSAPTPDQFHDQMRQIARMDPSMQHMKGDDLMKYTLSLLGYSDGIEVFNEMDIVYEE